LRDERLELPPGATKQVQLQVYCIDSHRASPTAKHSFHMGKKRLPRELRTEISVKAKAALVKHRAPVAASAPAAKAEIQSDVWKARNKKWIKLDGERAAEKAAPSRIEAPRLRIHKQPLRRQQSLP
jgi:hypothetical protein